MNTIVGITCLLGLGAWLLARADLSPFSPWPNYWDRRTSNKCVRKALELMDRGTPEGFAELQRLHEQNKRSRNHRRWQDWRRRQAPRS